MNHVTYGYIRVSTKDQCEDRQRLALMRFGVTPEHIILDKKSGKNFDRPGYHRLCKKLKPGDTLIIPFGQSSMPPDRKSAQLCLFKPCKGCLRAWFSS